MEATSVGCRALRGAWSARGVPAIIAMQAPVGDRYSTELMGASTRRWPPGRSRARLPPSATPAAILRIGGAPIGRRCSRRRSGRHLPFLQRLALAPVRRGQAVRSPQGSPGAVYLDPGVVVRRIGDMVGRRREQRRILNALRDANGAGVLIHGIGGVGKSTLAAQILHRLADADGFLLISLEGETDPDRILGAIGARLFSISLAQGEDEKAPLRQLAGVLREPKHPWRDRFEFLAQNLLTHVPVAFLFDNFEDNLKDGAPAEDLAALLACWLKAPLKSRLVFTCRYPFDLPDDVHERLDPFHLGPLSWAETRKLFWRLDGLKALSPDDQRRAYESVGGHPRALEYLDAILCGGAARFPDVQSRLRKQLKAKGIGDPARWCADTAGGLDAALAETVTLAADDVLLDQLIAQLTDEPLARRLLIGASVYRVAVENEALEADLPIEIALTRGGGVTYVSMGMAPEGFAAAKQRLMDLSLLALVRFADDEDEMFFVHRWTAGALAERASEKEWRDAHRAAAAYWRRRADARPRSCIADLLEARHHLHAVRDLAQLYEVSGFIITQLETWGAWEWEERLIGRRSPGCRKDRSKPV